MPVALGLDVGERRIGVARSDGWGLLATPMTAVLRTSDRAAVEAIARLAHDAGAGLLVVGLPLDERGQLTPQAQRSAAFARKLGSLPGMQVVFWNERYSSARGSPAPARDGPRAGPGLAPATRMSASRGGVAGPRPASAGAKGSGVTRTPLLLPSSSRSSWTSSASRDHRPEPEPRPEHRPEPIPPRGRNHSDANRRHLHDAPDGEHRGGQPPGLHHPQVRHRGHRRLRQHGPGSVAAAGSNAGPGAS